MASSFICENSIHCYHCVGGVIVQRCSGPKRTVQRSDPKEGAKGRVQKEGPKAQRGGTKGPSKGVVQRGRPKGSSKGDGLKGTVQRGRSKAIVQLCKGTVQVFY